MNAVFPDWRCVPAGTESGCHPPTGGCPCTNNRDLRISEATVKTHLLKIFEKLGVADRTSALSTAIERGLIELPGRG
jgi:hypothetical protein